MGIGTQQQVSKLMEQSKDSRFLSPRRTDRDQRREFMPKRKAIASIFAERVQEDIYAKALNVLKKMPVEKEFVTEQEAAKFSREMAQEMAEDPAG